MAQPLASFSGTEEHCHLHERLCGACGNMVGKVVTHLTSADKTKAFRGLHHGAWTDVLRAAQSGCYICSSMLTAAKAYQSEHALHDEDADRLCTNYSTSVFNVGIPQKRTAILVYAGFKAEYSAQGRPAQRLHNVEEGNITIFANFAIENVVEPLRQGPYTRPKMECAHISVKSFMASKLERS